jgi:lipopolysaccharide/colanic/teichoic acid biosynthesis glycosyltransferase
MYYLFFKRFFDIFLSIIAITISFPFLLIISIVISFDSPGPIIYKGVRSALNRGTFKIYKFRTMVNNAENKGGFSTANSDPRVTRVGIFLRKYKLDELPQFFNVLNGEMSLVGPRPQVLYYTDKYTDKESVILSVKPGITDLASLYFSSMDQTLGDVDVDQKYESEIEPIKNILRIRYAQERTFLMDMRILIETACNLAGIENITKLNIEP